MKEKKEKIKGTHSSTRLPARSVEQLKKLSEHYGETLSRVLVRALEVLWQQTFFASFGDDS